MVLESDILFGRELENRREVSRVDLGLSVGRGFERFEEVGEKDLFGVGFWEEIGLEVFEGDVWLWEGNLLDGDCLVDAFHDRVNTLGDLLSGFSHFCCLITIDKNSLIPRYQLDHLKLIHNLIGKEHLHKHPVIPLHLWVFFLYLVFIQIKTVPVL
jgi:hypothetical protein